MIVHNINVQNQHKKTIMARGDTDFSDPRQRECCQALSFHAKHLCAVADPRRSSAPTVTTARIQHRPPKGQHPWGPNNFSQLIHRL